MEARTIYLKFNDRMRPTFFQRSLCPLRPRPAAPIRVPAIHHAEASVPILAFYLAPHRRPAPRGQPPFRRPTPGARADGLLHRPCRLPRCLTCPAVAAPRAMHAPPRVAHRRPDFARQVTPGVTSVRCQRTLDINERVRGMFYLDGELMDKVMGKFNA